MVAVHLGVAVLDPRVLTNPGVRSYLASAPFLGDGNDFGLSVNIAIPLCWALVVTAKTKFGRLLYAVALLVLVACVVATQSRGATVGLACVAIYYWLRTEKKLLTALVVAVGVALILLLAPGAYFERMHNINTTESSAVGRIDGWKAAWAAALKSPVLGVGAGHFNVAIRRLTAHSIYFLAVGELGFPGLAVLVFLILANLAANRRRIAEIRMRGRGSPKGDLELAVALSASMIAFAVSGAFLSALYYPHLYVLGGVSVAGRHVVSQAYSPSGGTMAS
jgi:probable O-glycosylation ligase (exosortase A-associated)